MTQLQDNPRTAAPPDPFMAAICATPVPIVISDPRQPDNPVIFANEAFCTLTGYHLDEIIGRNCRFMQGPHTDPDAIARMRRAVAAGERIAIDLRNHRKDGVPFWNRLVIAPVRDAAQQLVYFVASQLNVTVERERLPGLEADNEALLGRLAERLAALEESEARFRHMADSAPVVVWTADDTGACTWLSQSWTLLTGQAAEVGLGDGWLASVHPDDVAAVQRGFHAAQAGQATVRLEYRVRQPDGTYAWVIDAAAPRFGEDARFLGHVGSRLDITDRRTAEARLELSEESLRLATDAAEIGTWDIAMPAHTLSASDRARAIFSLPAKAVSRPSDIEALIHPADRARNAASFAAMVDPARRHPYQAEFRVPGAGGAPRWVAVKGKALFDLDGHCLRAIGTAMDVTEGKAAEARQAVRLAISDRIRSLGTARAVARAARAELGQHFDTEHVGFVAIHPEEAPAFEGTEDGPDEPARLLAALDGPALATLGRGETMAWTAAATDPPGRPGAVIGLQALLLLPLLRERRLAGLLYVGMRHARPWPPADCSLVEDIAARIWDAMERSRAEAALRELNATLETRVTDRTAALLQAEEALRQAQKMEAVGQLTGGIAHDFNNLLTGIVGALDMLQRRVAAGRFEGLQRYTEIATSAAQRAGALTQRLLAYARRQPLDPRPTDANQLVASMEDLLRRTLGPAIALDLVLDEGLWTTLCDPNQLESALLNLAINARDAMPHGGSLTIATRNATLDGTDAPFGQYVGISVADTGTGMTPAVMDRMFEPFFTTKAIGEGTGLGLSMLYGFAKQSEGHVRVQSEPGRGTTVHIYLPLHAGLSDAAERLAPAPPALLRNGRGVVLVVEDEAAIRTLILETLAECGYTALDAPDGPAGLSILASGAQVDLLVTDVGLPGINGRQVADAARALRPGLSVLFITGYAHNAAIGKAVLEQGMQMMTKPFAMTALATKIRGMMLAE